MVLLSQVKFTTYGAPDITLFQKKIEYLARGHAFSLAEAS
jgi:hypothetical protein